MEIVYPHKPRVMKQKWEDVFFTHWPLPEAVLRQYIPDGLELDTYGGKAWLGMVHFIMKGIYFRGLPVSVVPSFPEINVRTYVTYRGRPGVFFVSLDAKHWSTYMIARRWYNLAYYRANVSVRKQAASYAWESVRQDRRSRHAANFTGTYAPAGEQFYAVRGSLEHWLIERYRLYSVDGRQQLYCGAIHHPPWRLHKAEADIHDNTLAAMLPAERSDAKGYQEGGPIVHFSQGMETMFWNIQKLPVIR